tara:strand:+ start:43 stop:411 length:369 start_codon:yes stop_codon:yes gene_type:complete
MKTKNIETIIKRFENPDEVSLFEKGKFEKVELGSMVIGRATYEPGWKWTEHVGPNINKDYCDVEHVGMVISGKAVASFPNGKTTVLNPGDLFFVPGEPHDSWVVGDKPYVSLHFLGAEKYTK